MMKKYHVLAFACCLALPSALAAQLKMAIQVTDVHNAPVPNVEITIAGRGVSGLRTSKQGTTRITLPEGVELADTVTLQLDAESSKNWIFIQPWNGQITIPKQKFHTLIVLAKPGDRSILETGVGVMAVLKDIGKNVLEAKKSAKADNEKLLSAVKDSTRKYGFTLQQVDQAARQRQTVTQDPKEKETIAAYTTNTATLMSYLSELPDYEKRQKTIDKLSTLNNMVTTAICLYAQSLPGFCSTTTGYQMFAEKSRVENSIGVMNKVYNEIVVWPRFYMTIDDNDVVTIKAQDDEILQKPFSDLNEEVIKDIVGNYFTPRIQRITREVTERKKSNNKPL